jgi:UTP--glucose-1-phosphate uridylyltransferase
MAARIRKAVFPVAGLGTRFLPATKANPKEMLPVVDKPLVQYAVEEAVAAGAETLIFITGRNKRGIADHFDCAYELEAELAKRNKHERLEQARRVLPEGVECVYLRQANALGLGHAVWCARNLVGDEPFFVLLADDLVRNHGRPVVDQMRERYEATGGSIIGVQRVAEQDVSKYGIVSGEPVDEKLRRLTGIVEKPSPEKAPSNLGVIGRYLVPPSIF